MTKTYLIRRINKCAKRDQTALKQGVDDKAWTKTTRKNTFVLKSIVLRYGWPTPSLVGKVASRNAWLLVQHADHDIAFQKRCLKLMERIYEKNPNNISKENIAFLRDRVSVNQGRKQLFGTQLYRNKEGLLNPRPIGDLKNLDERRKKFKLSPLKTYLSSARSNAKSILIKKSI